VWAFIKDELYKVRSRLHTRDDVWREAVQIWYSERLDECPEYEAKRKATVETLRRYGVPLQENYSLENLIKDIQIDPRLRKISKLGRQLVLHSIKTFTGNCEHILFLKVTIKKIHDPVKC